MPKPDNKAKFRITIDLRPLNNATVKESWPLSDVDAEMQDFFKSSCFAILDFASGYWRLPVHQDSITKCGIVTPNEVYASTRVLQGLTNAV